MARKRLPGRRAANDTAKLDFIRPVWDALGDGRAAFLHQTQRRLKTLALFISDTDKREERWEYELLNSERKDLRDRLESVPRELRDEADRVERELENVQKKLPRSTADKKAQLERRLVFGRARLADLRQEQRQYETRVKEILQSTDRAPRRRSEED